MDRFWLLTWTTYGTWLPGDPRGFVSEQTDKQGIKFIHNVPGTDFDKANCQLESAMKSRLKSPPVRLALSHAEIVLAQFHETARIRAWKLLAVALMANHVHLVVGVPGDPDPGRILGDFKSYGSRALNSKFACPPSRTWWTESGSKRKLPTDESVLAASRYVRDQEFPLKFWIDPLIIQEIGERGT